MQLQQWPSQKISHATVKEKMLLKLLEIGMTFPSCHLNGLQVVIFMTKKWRQSFQVTLETSRPQPEK